KSSRPVFELNRDAALSLLHTARLELPEGWALDLSLAETISPSGRHIVVRATLSLQNTSGAVVFRTEDVGEGVLVDTKTAATGEVEDDVADIQGRAAATRAIKRALEHFAPAVSEVLADIVRRLEQYMYAERMYATLKSPEGRQETERKLTDYVVRLAQEALQRGAPEAQNGGAAKKQQKPQSAALV
ncbi:MAG: hypothetical protein RMK98_09090, partial [Bacteroidia bacterium]|nr:hypothetical protein [Bacteroidia bacterium]